MITYQTEKWAAVYPDMEPILQLHWREIGLMHDKVPLDVDYDRYQALCDTGQLCVITAREDGKLIGYHVVVVTPHLHYKSTLHGQTDVYFILPEYRKGFTGIRLFKESEKFLRALGVKKLYTGCKLHKDMARLFEHLDYRETERVYTKWIGD